MAYLNYKLAKERGLTPQDVNFLQILHQNSGGEMENILSEVIDENDIASYDSSGLIKFVKGRKKDSDLFKMRLSDKGKKIYRDITSYKTVEADFSLLDYVIKVYKHLEKNIGSRNKIVNLIAAFRSESGLTHKEIYFLIKEFVSDDDNMEYNIKLEYMFFKPQNVYENFKLENSRLWVYHQNKEYAN